MFWGRLLCCITPAGEGILFSSQCRERKVKSKLRRKRSCPVEHCSSQIRLTGAAGVSLSSAHRVRGRNRPWTGHQSVTGRTPLSHSLAESSVRLLEWVGGGQNPSRGLLAMRRHMSTRLHVCIMKLQLWRKVFIKKIQHQEFLRLLKP